MSIKWPCFSRHPSHIMVQIPQSSIIINTMRIKPRVKAFLSSQKLPAFSLMHIFFPFHCNTPYKSHLCFLWLVGLMSIDFRKQFLTDEPNKITINCSLRCWEKCTRMGCSQNLEMRILFGKNGLGLHAVLIIIRPTMLILKPEVQMKSYLIMHIITRYFSTHPGTTWGPIYTVCVVVMVYISLRNCHSSVIMNLT